MNTEDNKVIEFPVQKAQKRTVKIQQANESFASIRVKKIIPGLVLAIVAIYGLSNFLIFSSQSSVEKGQRELASVATFPHGQRDAQWEHRLAQKLAGKFNARSTASIGQNPHLQDDLVAKLLHENYLVQYDRGKISYFKFAEEVNRSAAPSYLNREQFLSAHKPSLAVEFDQYTRISRERDADRVREVYELQRASGEKRGFVHFEMDKFDRLLSMKVESSQKSQ